MELHIILVCQLAQEIFGYHETEPEKAKAEP